MHTSKCCDQAPIISSCRLCSIHEHLANLQLHQILGSERTYGITTIIQETPIILKMLWIRAERLACVLPTREANSAVIVVPIFSPKTMAAPISNGSHPFRHMVRVSVILALDDCTMTVRSAPTNTKNRRLKNPQLVNWLRNSRTSCSLSRDYTIDLVWRSCTLFLLFRHRRFPKGSFSLRPGCLRKAIRWSHRQFSMYMDLASP